MDDVFKALADPTRRRLLDSLRAEPGQNLGELCAGLDMARQSVSKHLGVLEGAGVVTVVWRGREKLHYVNAAPISDIVERWIRPYERARVDALADLKRALEDTPMTKPEFIYTTYIHTTPELLWKGLTDPAFTSRYWELTFETDWQVGSTMVWQHQGVSIADPGQVVLECEPPRRLSYTWHSFTPEWAAAFDFDEADRARLASERRSRVTFEIEPVGDQVKLTVIHHDLEPGSRVAELVSGGWPMVLSELKTFMERAGSVGSGD